MDRTVEELINRCCSPVTGIDHNGRVTTWKPHALAKPHAYQLALRTGDTVRAIVALPSTELGTVGKVILANGFNWLRYRVLFTNGQEIADLDSRQIEPYGRTAKRLAKAADKH
jgi:hypothetical protein